MSLPWSASWGAISSELCQLWSPTCRSSENRGSAPSGAPAAERGPPATQRPAAPLPHAGPAGGAARQPAARRPVRHAPPGPRAPPPCRAAAPGARRRSPGPAPASPAAAPHATGRPDGGGAARRLHDAGTLNGNALATKQRNVAKPQKNKNKKDRGDRSRRSATSHCDQAGKVDVSAVNCCPYGSQSGDADLQNVLTFFLKEKKEREK